MFGTIRQLNLKCRIAVFGGIAAAAICLGSPGCSSWDLRGDGWEDDSMSSSIRQARPPAKESDFWSFSNKARQIEADCGSQ
jgi:hypothetical protein